MWFCVAGMNLCYQLGGVHELSRLLTVGLPRTLSHLGHNQALVLSRPTSAKLNGEGLMMLSLEGWHCGFFRLPRESSLQLSRAVGP